MQSLSELVEQSQQLLTQIRKHPQFKILRFDCDVTAGDVAQFFNTLQYSTTDLDLSRLEGFNE
ncbi:hypothetical protein [Nostoc sp. FACHB-190]|uniref:hypothetical protein n=1 Tax=Nostoc sp. FACHB-190 TaxID=2692838 RepID=UPI0018EF5736|nr:hypothetical protein [Nostoc sp. FACHB-190]